MQRDNQQRTIFDYIRQHWSSWFPALPRYQAFNRRLNDLSPAFEIIINQLLGDKLKTADLTNDCLLDWFLVIIARGNRAGRSSLAAEIADLDFCASKQIYYHGVKLHALAVPRIKKLCLSGLCFLWHKLQRTIWRLSDNWILQFQVSANSLLLVCSSVSTLDSHPYLYLYDALHTFWKYFVKLRTSKVDNTSRFSSYKIIKTALGTLNSC